MTSATPAPIYILFTEKELFQLLIGMSEIKQANLVKKQWLAGSDLTNQLNERDLAYLTEKCETLKSIVEKINDARNRQLGY
jgi:hypothetical protein